MIDSIIEFDPDDMSFIYCEDTEKIETLLVGFDECIEETFKVSQNGYKTLEKVYTEADYIKAHDGE